MPKFSFRQAALALIAAGLGIAPAAAFNMPDWRSAHLRSHPLVGTLWRADGVEIGMEALTAAAAEADYVLLGEIHTNPDHHVIQARIVEEMAAAGRKPAIVFEMIPQGLGGALEAYLATDGADAEGLGAAIRWEERGWPDWTIYRPIAEAAFNAGLTMRPGDLDAGTIRRIGSQGAESLGPVETERLGLGRPLGAAEAAELTDLLEAAHCGMMPEAALGPMLDVQRARDGSLAAAMMGADEGDGSVLIAGAGHVRNDWAVPAVLGEKRPEADILSVALIEVEEGAADPADYGLSAKDPAPYDMVIFTPRADIADPCAALREQMEGAHDDE